MRSGGIRRTPEGDTHDRIPYFADAEHVGQLRAAFRQVKTARPFRMEVVVILPDHLHRVWQLPEGDDDFSGRWREIKKAASRQIGRATNARGEREPVSIGGDALRLSTLRMKFADPRDPNDKTPEPVGGL